ncbi:MAG: NAD(P)H-binding protein [Pseudomonadota bacterium]
MTNKNVVPRRVLGGVTLVLGGTGKTGRRVAERLVDNGVVTRVASRSAAIPFDWNDESTWPAALDGVTVAYISYSPDLAIPGATRTIGRFVTAAITHGVKRMVLLSGRGEEEAQACESILQESDIEWVIVRSSWFMQNFSEGEFLNMVLDGSITLPGGHVPEPFIDVNDIADVAVAALTEDGHAHEIYEVTGPRLMTLAEATADIARASGRPVSFEPIPPEAFAGALRDSGAPDDIVWLLNYLFETVLDGRNAYVSDGVQRALGRPATDFSEFADRIAARGDWAKSPSDAAA